MHRRLLRRALQNDTNMHKLMLICMVKDANLWALHTKMLFSKTECSKCEFMTWWSEFWLQQKIQVMFGNFEGFFQQLVSHQLQLSEMGLLVKEMDWLSSYWCTFDREDREDSSDWSINRRNRGERSEASPHGCRYARIWRRHQQPRLVGNYFKVQWADNVHVKLKGFIFQSRYCLYLLCEDDFYQKL